MFYCQREEIVNEEAEYFREVIPKQRIEYVFSYMHSQILEWRI